MSKASDVFYHVAVTMTTVGYGDISPQSFYGRVMAMIATIFGIYLATLLVTAMMISSEFTPNERTASQQVMSRVGKRNIVDESVKLIQCVWAFHVFKKHNRVIETFQTKKKFVFRAVDWNQEYSSRIVNHIRHLNVLFNRFHNNQAADLHANLEKAVLRMGERMRVLTSEVSTLSAHAKKAIAKNPHFFDEAEFVAKIKAQAIAEYKQQEFLNEKNGVVTGVTTSEVHSVNTQNVGEVIRPIEDGQQMEVKVLSPTAAVGVESKQTRPSVLDELMPGYTEAYLTPKPSVLDELMPGYTEAYLTPKPASSIQSALKLNTPTAANDAARLSVSNGGFFLPGKKPKPNKK
jgi:hypothetical protein